MAETKTYREALREAMVMEMDRDENVVLMGEDIGVYGGTHLITDGLIDQYGPKRVIDTPIRARLHRGGGRHGVPGHEAHSGDDDLELLVPRCGPDHPERRQGALLLGGQVEVPMVIRGPNGGGVQLSAQHTHSLENLYGHFPGLKVVSPVTPNDVKGMMLTAVRDPNPVIFLEAGALYGTKGG